MRFKRVDLPLGLFGSGGGKTGGCGCPEGECVLRLEI